MKRFAVELPVMRRRLVAAAGYGRPLTKGRVRKSSPFVGCAPSKHCPLCQCERREDRSARRRQRYAARSQIIEGLQQ